MARLLPLRMPKRSTAGATEFHAIPVAGVDRPTHDSVLIRFAVPHELREEFSFEPGQHVPSAPSTTTPEMRFSWECRRVRSTGRSGSSPLEGLMVTVVPSSRPSSLRAPAARGEDRRPTRKGDLQRDAILQAMTRLLEQKRFGELSVADITAEAGVTRSGFYFYFESKYAALGFASAELWSEFVEVTGSYVRPDDESVTDFVERVLNNALRIWQAHEALLIASVQALALNDELARTWRGQVARIADLISQQVERDRAAGLVIPVLDDVPTLVRRLGEATMYLLYQDRNERADASASAQTVDVLKHIWLASIGARD